MFGFTRKTDYALVALAGLAEVSGDDPARLSARRISERYGVPLPVLMNVLKNLVGGGLVSSTRGARGGYALARSPEGISVNDVISAIEGPVQVMNCCEPDETPERVGAVAPDCRMEVRCPITKSVRRLNERINDYLREVTLADLMRNEESGLGPPRVRTFDIEFRHLAKEDR